MKSRKVQLVNSNPHKLRIRWPIKNRRGRRFTKSTRAIVNVKSPSEKVAAYTIFDVNHFCELDLIGITEKESKEDQQARIFRKDGDQKRKGPLQCQVAMARTDP